MPSIFSRHRIISWLCAAALALVLGGSLWAFLALRGIVGSPLILHFNDIDGITSVGGSAMILFMGAFGVLVTIMNFFIAAEFESRRIFFGKFLASMTLVFAVLLFIAFAAIINVNV